MTAFIHYIKRLYAFSGKILYVNLLGMIAVSFLDSISILLLIVLLNVSGILHASVMSTMWGLLDFMTGSLSHIGLPVILGAYIFLIIVQNLLAKSIAIRDVKIHHGFINHLKEELYQSLLQVKWTYYLQTRKSNIINSLTKDLNRVSIGIKMFMLLITNLVFTLFQIGIAFYLAPQVTALVLVCGLVLALFSWRFVKQAKITGKETTQLSREYLAGITDNLNGIKDIKTNTLESSRLKWLVSLNKRVLTEQEDFVRMQTNSQLSYKTALACIIALFIFSSVHFIHTKPDQLLLVIIIFSRLWPRFVDIQLNIQQLASSLPAFTLLLSLQKQTAEYKEDIYTEAKQPAPLCMKHSIQCRDISFKYGSNPDSYALQEINITIPARYMTAIVGKSGAGKSTLIDLLMGLNRPNSGSLVIDGVPLTDSNLLSFRKTISYVSQEPFLFHTSIRKNLLLVKPDASEEQLWEALNFAAADGFVKKLPKKLDTQIGDRGVRLSGGERQRLVLARAILRKPSILILDEATSALDTHNEAAIQKAIERMRGEITVIVIAHRLSTIRHADQIIVLDQGKIRQQGRFVELSQNSKGVFHQLLTKQL
ncbi:ABC transporter ATP-binding protein/permease [Domibacillus sp. PGB-M46]|uniref:ABC transporter ATP-binding protein n=1 Tax=Domibacillus sp. PGB-M46 TaxID=2910255 RepID=UPI001F58EFF8|nr:ABC transporter ATP-binding protein [Domibacillus sp. PGB-M46]MCI2252751.1 ABC transporter ATP-binding protein/permease [Domibacillus sp. PGB-M46]